MSTSLERITRCERLLVEGATDGRARGAHLCGIFGPEYGFRLDSLVDSLEKIVKHSPKMNNEEMWMKVSAHIRSQTGYGIIGRGAYRPTAEMTSDEWAATFAVCCEMLVNHWVEERLEEGEVEDAALYH
jgi:hypothetical protein